MFRVRLYADDTSLFISLMLADIEVSKQILLTFDAASGLMANVEKSVLLRIACDEIDLRTMLQNFPVPIKVFPCKYLGLPLHFRKICGSDAQLTMDKMVVRLHRWHGKLLSSDARLNWVNSVLSAIPIYLLSIFKLDAWDLKQMDKLQKNFLWCSKPDNNGSMALVNWTTVCCSKHLGNLGVIYLYHFGRALKLRWNWYDWTDVERPWAGSLIPYEKIDHDLFRASTMVEIVNGLRAQFWHDCWLGNKVPCVIAPDIFKLCTRKKLSVAEAVNDHR